MAEHEQLKAPAAAPREHSPSTAGPAMPSTGALLGLSALAGNRAVTSLVGSGPRRAAVQRTVSTTGFDPNLAADKLVSAITIGAFPAPKWKVDREAAASALANLTREQGRAVKAEYQRRTGRNLGWLLSNQEVPGVDLSPADQKRLLNLLAGTVPPPDTAAFVEGTGAVLGDAVRAAMTIVGQPEAAAAVTEVADKVAGETIRKRAREHDARTRAETTRAAGASAAAAYRAALDRHDVDRAVEALRRPGGGKEAMGAEYLRHFGEPIELSFTRLGAGLPRALAMWGGYEVVADQLAIQSDVAEQRKVREQGRELAAVGGLMGDYQAAREAQAKAKVERRVETILDAQGRKPGADEADAQAHIRKVLEDPAIRRDVGADVMGSLVEALAAGKEPEALAIRLVRADQKADISPADIEGAMRELREAAGRVADRQIEAQPDLEEHRTEVHDTAAKEYLDRFEHAWDGHWPRKRTFQQALSGQGDAKERLVASMGMPVDEWRRKQAGTTDAIRNRALREGGGTMPEWQDLYYALTRSPKDMPRVRAILDPKTTREVEDLRKVYDASVPKGHTLELDLLGTKQQQQALELFDNEAREANAEKRMLLEGGTFSPEAVLEGLGADTDPAVREIALLTAEGRWLFDRIVRHEARIRDNRGLFARARDWAGNTEEQILSLARRDGRTAKTALDQALGSDPKSLDAARTQVEELRRVHVRLTRAADVYKEATARAYDAFVDAAVMVTTMVVGLGGGGILIGVARETAARIGTKILLKDDYSAEEFIADIRDGAIDLATGSVMKVGWEPLAKGIAGKMPKSWAKSWKGQVAKQLGAAADWEVNTAGEGALGAALRDEDVSAAVGWDAQSQAFLQHHATGAVHAYGEARAQKRRERGEGEATPEPEAEGATRRREDTAEATDSAAKVVEGELAPEGEAPADAEPVVRMALEEPAKPEAVARRRRRRETSETAGGPAERSTTEASSDEAAARDQRGTAPREAALLRKDTSANQRTREIAGHLTPLFHAWGARTTAERQAHLQAVVREQLTRSGLDHPVRVILDPTIRPGEASFNPRTFEIRISREQVRADTISARDFASLADAIAHETRHAQHHFRGIRAALDHGVFDFDADIPAEVIIDAQAANRTPPPGEVPMTRDSPAFGEAFEIYQQTFGEGAQRRRDVIQQRDDTAAARDRLRQEWRERWANAPDSPAKQAFQAELARVTREATLAHNRYVKLPQETDAHRRGESTSKAVLERLDLETRLPEAEQRAAAARVAREQADARLREAGSSDAAAARRARSAAFAARHADRKARREVEALRKRLDTPKLDGPGTSTVHRPDDAKPVPGGQGGEERSIAVDPSEPGTTPIGDQWTASGGGDAPVIRPEEYRSASPTPALPEPQIQAIQAAVRDQIVQRLEPIKTIGIDDSLTIRTVTGEMRQQTDHPVNALVLKHLEIVTREMQDPQFIADVVSDIYADSLRDPARTPDLDALTRAILRAASGPGDPIHLIPADANIGVAQFFENWVSTGRQALDLAVGGQHGNVVHLIQDVIVTRAFERAGLSLTGPDFRQLLGQISTGPASTYPDPGNQLWIAMFDSLDLLSITRPEVIIPALRSIPELQDLR